jgi:hypothetical protein
MTEAIKQAIAIARGYAQRAGQIELNNAEVGLLADAVCQLALLVQQPTVPVSTPATEAMLPAELVFVENAPCNHLLHLADVLRSDLDITITADLNYRGSWKRRGGTGAFHMLARKWDRLEPRVEAYGFDVFEAIAQDVRREGAIDDVRDLRRYLALVEAECVRRGAVKVQALSKDSAK